MNALTLDPVTLAYHELRSPLGLVATAMRAMAEDSVDEALRHQVELVMRTVERMLRTTERVFVMARGGVAEEAQWYIPAEVAAVAGAELAAAGLPIEVIDGGERARHFGSRGICETLVHSLLSNACDHHDPHTPVRLVLTADGSIPVITVTNRIGTRGRHNGLGVGSYLAQRLAEQAGASVTSDQDGASFRVTIRFGGQDERAP